MSGVGRGRRGREGSDGEGRGGDGKEGKGGMGRGGEGRGGKGTGRGRKGRGRGRKEMEVNNNLSNSTVGFKKVILFFTGS